MVSPQAMIRTYGYRYEDGKRVRCELPRLISMML
jgi:hypothetical protein